MSARLPHACGGEPHIAHLKDSFCDVLPNKVDEYGRIHPTVNVTRTETGRWSMKEPNLQQIPSRSELGKAIRKAFVAEEGNLLVAIDYSQIEMRVAAHLTGCRSMIDLFLEGYGFFNFNIAGKGEAENSNEHAHHTKDEMKHVM